jgi:hypothetical protein
MAEDNSSLSWLRRHIQRRRLEGQQHRAGVRAYNVSNVNELARLGDTELIATSPGLGNGTHQMELSRRLKVAIEQPRSRPLA